MLATEEIDMEHCTLPYPRIRTATGAFELMAITGSGIHPRLLAHALARGPEAVKTSAAPVIAVSR
jgi:hypothetical protein